MKKVTKRRMFEKGKELATMSKILSMKIKKRRFHILVTPLPILIISREGVNKS